MKKILSIMLTISLILPTLLTFQVSASEVGFFDYDQHIALAKETFPEYANKLDGTISPRSTESLDVASEFNVAVRETRAASSNTIMTYTEYDNGLATLATARFSKNAYIDIQDSETYSGYELYTATIVASVVEGPTFTATDVQYRIYPINYDRISSTGTPGIPGYTSDDFTIYSTAYETADSPAFVTYSFDCPVGTSHYSGAVIFEVANNKTSVVFDIW